MPFAGDNTEERTRIDEETIHWWAVEERAVTRVDDGGRGRSLVIYSVWAFVPAKQHWPT